MSLAGRVAVVTGASSGIGRGIALRLAAEGARVVVQDVREQPKVGKYHETEPQPPTAEVIQVRGGSAVFVGGDVSDPATAEAVINAAKSLGGLDILVNNAGIHLPAGIQTLAIDQWDRVIGVNLRGVFLMTRAAVPLLKQSRAGRIIHIASVHAYGGVSGPAYAPAKAAVVNLGRDNAIELGPFGITVNTICPGYIETPLQDYLEPEQIEACRERTPLKRLGKVTDVAAAAAFFASDEAAWITGADLPVDGGYTAFV